MKRQVVFLAVLVTFFVLGVRNVYAGEADQILRLKITYRYFSDVLDFDCKILKAEGKQDGLICLDHSGMNAFALNISKEEVMLGDTTPDYYYISAKKMITLLRGKTEDGGEIKALNVDIESLLRNPEKVAVCATEATISRSSISGGEFIDFCLRTDKSSANALQACKSAVVAAAQDKSRKDTSYMMKEIGKPVTIDQNVEMEKGLSFKITMHTKESKSQTLKAYALADSQSDDTCFIKHIYYQH